ncbi:MAG: sel1 repeat family protein [Hyphomicrobiales bacterium]|nr:sel1 repeat family protein [Hyphomicrobiales bacterium]
MSANRTVFKPLLFLAALLAGGSFYPAWAAEIRGKVHSVEANGELNVDIPAGAYPKLGDEVRIEADIPGVGPVEIKSRWRVKMVGDGFLIAAPVGDVSGKPKIGHTAIVSTTDAAAAAGTKPTSGPQAPPATALDITKVPTLPSLKLSSDDLAGLKSQADAGKVGAMKMLGLYHAGNPDPSDSVSRSLDEAVRWYEKAVQADDDGAMTSLGLVYLDRRKDAIRAADWFGKAAEKGDAAAMSLLALLYADGRGVARDDSKGFEWIKKAAEAGDERAGYELANMYFEGRGTRQDFVEAAHWYRKAADKGDMMAMNRLARMYINGLGLAQDVKRGFEWTLKAAEKGSAIAMYQTGTHYLQGAGVVANPAEAKKWYEKAANAGEAEGMFGLSYLYDKGQGVAASPGMAADWMILAIRSKSFQAVESVMRTPQSWSENFRKEFQKRLREAGVYTGKIDGDIGSGSRRAIAELVQAAP